MRTLFHPRPSPRPRLSWRARVGAASWLMVVLALPLGAAGWADEDSGRYLFENYAGTAGLPGSVVTAVAQGRDGYIWVGTTSGLARFDGVRFVSFRAADTPGLGGDLIHALLVDADGALWIGSDAGLTRVRGGKFEPVNPTPVAVRAVARGAAGEVWAGTVGRGLWVVRGGEWSRPEIAGLPAEAKIRALHADADGRLWVALERERGVWRVERGVARPYDGDNPFFGEILTIAEQPRGTLWFGTQRAGLFRLRDGALNRIVTEAGGGTLPVRQVMAGRDGKVWLAAGALLRMADPAQPRPVVVTGVPNRNVRVLAEDAEGGLWLGAGAEGLARMHPMPYRLLARPEGLPQENVKNVAQDAAGDLWVSVRGHGILRLSPDGTVRDAVEEGLPQSDPAVVWPARDGSVWAGISSHLWVRREGLWRQHTDLRFVRGLFEDAAGAMWIGTDEMGLFRWRYEKLDEVRTADGAHIAAATAFATAPDQTLYVGTWRGGLYRVRGDNAEPVRIGGGARGAEVRAVHVDAEGRLWVGLNGRGLAVGEGGRWTNPAALTAALGGQVSAIIEDGRGRIWFGTLAGILWAWKAELLPWLRDGGGAPPLHAIAAGDEVRSLPVWSGGQPVAWRAADGGLLFATRRGVVAIDPARTFRNDVPPPILLERVLVDRQPAPPGAAVRLPPGMRSLAFEYTAPSFVQPETVGFSVRLEGYDPDWVDVGNRRSAFYGALPPGEYTFRVRARNGDGVWSTRAAAMQVVQLPHFYETLWFRVLVVAALAAAGWGAYLWSHRQLRLRLERLERERAMEAERRRIAQDLHDDLGASLTEIGLYAEHARRAPAEADRGLEAVGQRVRSLAASLDAIVWAVNPANDSLDQLVSYVAELFQELFRASGIRARLEVVGDVPRYPLSAEERSHLFLTAKEAMHNVLKHSGAREAWLRIAWREERLTLVVEDNGSGFDPAAGRAGGNGLANMRSRIARVGGTIDWQSGPGGTRVIVTTAFPGRKPLPDSGSPRSFS
ncbi:sensor histidine kinase [Opitutus sp. ER46]|uniref:sensor histidine kinase n=1 Tax=Opitutus sp. ER46 TaxID=2161864 RepID=UPI0011B20390|nr:sensor histidine kinase [Opitutus sp. ER46]